MNKKGNHCRQCNTKPGTKASRRLTTKGYLLFIILLCILASNNIIKRISCCAKQYSNEATHKIFSNSINFLNRKAYNSHIANHGIYTSKIFSSNSDEYDDNNDDDKYQHPIIVYKYDIIDENNDKLQLDEDLQDSRDRESYTLLKPKKIYFDFMPNKPLLRSEDVFTPKLKAEKDNIIKPSDGNYEEAAILKTNTKQYEPYNYHDRKKRDIESLALRNLQKRTPRFDYLPPICTNCATNKPIQQLINYIKHAVPGKKHNALDIPIPAVATRTGIMPDMNVSIDSRIAADENERVIFSSGHKPTNRPKSNRRPPEVIYRDPRPQSFDANFINGNSIGFQANRFVPASSGSAQRPESSASRPPAAAAAAAAASSAFLPTNSRPTAAAPERKASITQCVWAIVNCCSSNSNEIRYSCFERNGCFGAFWDLNPCAVEVLDSVVTFVGDYYE